MIRATEMRRGDLNKNEATKRPRQNSPPNIGDFLQTPLSMREAVQNPLQHPGIMQKLRDADCAPIEKNHFLSYDADFSDWPQDFSGEKR
jgi:hypothetical protein